MASVFLIEEQTVAVSGVGPSVGVQPGEQLQLTLGVLEVKEQQSLDVGIHGSADGETWSPKPITAFPQKFYAGTSSIVLRLASFPDTRFIRAAYKVNRWGHWKDGPAFRLYLFSESAA